MPEQFTNGATTTVASGITSGATSVTVTGPTSGSPPFPASGTFRIRNTRTGELVKVVGVSGTTWDLTGGRGDGGSTAAAMNAGDTLEQDLTAEALAIAFARADTANAQVIQAQGFSASGVGSFSSGGRYLGMMPGAGPPSTAGAVAGDFGFDTNGSQWFFNGTVWLRPGMLPNGYAQVTASQTGITTEADLTGLTITVTVPANQRIRLGFRGMTYSTVANDDVQINLKEGGTVLQQAVMVADTANTQQPTHADVVLVPSAGAHTYKASLQRAVGTGNVALFATATAPAYLLAEILGP